MAAAKIKVEYSDHARERLKERSITRAQIVDCLFHGNLAGFDVRGRKISQKKIGSHTLIVIFLDVAGGGKVVVTAYWKGVFP